MTHGNLFRINLYVYIQVFQMIMLTTNIMFMIFQLQKNDKQYVHLHLHPPFLLVNTIKTLTHDDTKNWVHIQFTSLNDKHTIITIVSYHHCYS